ncbi:hypothetical protein RFF05_00050 [Bengtsoniella intestinalis]|uniref:hypothetical protein n=1 Tax=Bengtsoniella intestinalis TaxID=3073143 RepID=UPI00391F747F
MLVSLSQAMVPKGTLAGVSNFIGGLLLLITLLTPLSQLDSWLLPEGLDDYRDQIQDQQLALTTMQQPS